MSIKDLADRSLMAIKRVRELHHPFNPGSACDCCVVEDECDVCGEYYPCSTIRALDGDV